MIVDVNSVLWALTAQSAGLALLGLKSAPLPNQRRSSKNDTCGRRTSLSYYYHHTFNAAPH